MKQKLKGMMRLKQESKTLQLLIQNMIFFQKKEIEVFVVEETVKKDETVTTPTTEDKVTNKINNNKKSQKTTAVKTGDSTSIGTYSLFAFLSVLLTVMLKKYRFE